MSHHRFVTVFLASVLLIASPPPSESSQISFSLGQTGLAFQDGTLLLATRLSNTSDQNAYGVELDTISLNSAALVSPIALPVPLGEIDGDDTAVIEASFSRGDLMPGQQYLLQVHGSYRTTKLAPSHERCGDRQTIARIDEKVCSAKSNRLSFVVKRACCLGPDGKTRCKSFPHCPSKDGGHEFTLTMGVTLPPVAPGSRVLQQSTVSPSTVSGGGFPPVQMPINFEEANESGPPVPTGVFVPGTPTKSVTGAQPDPGDPSVTFNANDPLNLISGPFNGNASTVAEPSGASNGGGVIFSTANWTAAYSTNSGNAFTQLDPTTIFPNDAVGFCCDQVVQYVPAIDRFIWLLQGNGYRIASASPSSVSSSGGTAWTYWTLTPGFFGLTGSLDYPDMSVGTSYLYLSFDEVGTGLMVARIKLSEIEAGGTITVEWTDPKDGGPAYGSHVTQDTGSEVFWAGHNSTSQMRVFSLAEGSGSYFWRDVNISSWANTGLSSTTPDNVDWLTKLQNFPGTAVIGATRAPGPPTTTEEFSSDGLWFAWSAGTDSNFGQPHVEMVTLDRANNFVVAQQVQIWNNSYAFVYPALATNACTEEVGLSLEYGGNGNFENHVVGFWGDFVVYITTNSNVGTSRYGDYVTIRQDLTPGLNGAFFDAFGYGLRSPVAGQTGTQTDVRYILFGRGGACIIG